MQSTHSGKGTRMDDMERETLIGERAGKDVGADFEQSIENLKGLLGEKEKSVSINLISAPKIVGENEKKYGNEAEAHELDMRLKIRSAEVATVSSGVADITTPRACVDVRDMGLLSNLLATNSIPEMIKSSWAEEVDKRMNAVILKGILIRVI
ncbi:hypothetical protein V6N11_079191 [Hibiscus sabdariffa]|uniref:Uncharacterized protein n=1 Tax=Hibiscus sabdariffa TaxID=183260 RepID=A0ABR2RUU0_9ROSI